ncbi:hypothetical protein OPW13_13535 [Vibrio europaeus]|uniref:Mor transcription activator domain-containing protein n=1 Tax=Vibrio penaeicida TaxID=104609 RepID=A0AAV5NTG2_9VIBR|nr:MULTISPECIES: Mor transcription activator family protein [Vibrio]MDC5862714.1 hypothetical protein [Vibrio europaeus]MDC5864321.1 hypothetical protein [Vibrio europaeus]MDC5864441.1 hypothetical protein [Vibrio europaeus]MDC5865022.1 hypothetical protein [Vibrio europaeus]RTZ22690.1 hypothetical protein EKN09_12785 [Vibrio penaeicida]
MSISWLDIANKDMALNVVIDLIKMNPSKTKVFDEFLSRSKEFNLEERDTVKFICLMVSVFGGCQIYLPSDDAFKQAVTYRLIYKEFKGNNANELSRKYGMSVIAIQRVIKACRKADAEIRKAMDGVK